MKLLWLWHIQEVIILLIVFKVPLALVKSHFLKKILKSLKLENFLGFSFPSFEILICDKSFTLNFSQKLWNEGKYK